MSQRYTWLVEMQHRVPMTLRHAFIKILCNNVSTGSPRYMRSFFLRFRIYLNEKWPFSWNLSSNLWYSQVFLYANSLYSSLFLESLSLAYNEVHLYVFRFVQGTKQNIIFYLQLFKNKLAFLRNKIYCLHLLTVFYLTQLSNKQTI